VSAQTPAGTGANADPNLSTVDVSTDKHRPRVRIVPDAPEPAKLLEAARWAARRGWYVHPVDHPYSVRCAGPRTDAHDPDTCEKRGKHPATAWSKGATRDMRTIEGWFGQDLRNVGIACGPSGLVVIDEDAPGEFASFAMSVGETVPDTFTVTTGNGRHFYFAAPSDITVGNSEGALAGYKINVRGNSGYVVGPGSRHVHGDQYRPVDEGRDVLPLPHWVLAAITKPRPGKDRADGVLATGSDAIPEHHRHTTLAAYVGGLRERGLTKEEARLLTMKAWERCAQPPVAEKSFDRQEAEDLLDDIYSRYPSNYEKDVAQRLHQLKVNEAAQERFRVERDGPPKELDAGLLKDVLARPREVAWRISGLLPSGGRMLLSAKAKTGKTTAAMNIARAVLIGEDVFGSFPASQIQRKVAFLNYEVTSHQVAAWANDVGVPIDGLLLVNLRGARNPLSSREGRAQLADLLQRHEVELLIVDPFGRAYAGESQNDAGQVGHFLADLDELAAEAGVKELILTAHTGWEGSHTRGSSALEDWPDVVVSVKSDDHGARYLRAFGRDVDVPEDRLNFDPGTRMLTLTDEGGQRAHAARRHRDDLVDQVVRAVAQTPDITAGGLEEQLHKAGVSMQKGDASKAATEAHRRGLITRTRRGKNVVHRVANAEHSPTSPDVPHGE